MKNALEGLQLFLHGALVQAERATVRGRDRSDRSFRIFHHEDCV